MFHESPKPIQGEAQILQCRPHPDTDVPHLNIGGEWLPHDPVVEEQGFCLLGSHFQTYRPNGTYDARKRYVGGIFGLTPVSPSGQEQGVVGIT
jgi:hypothetical protein